MNQCLPRLGGYGAALGRWWGVGAFGGVWEGLDIARLGEQLGLRGSEAPRGGQGDKETPPNHGEAGGRLRVDLRRSEA